MPQPDLLSWEPPQTVLAFEEVEVRGATLAARISRAVSVALRDCGQPRKRVAKAMGDYLGEDVSPAMLDAYASVGRDQHRISVPRMMALMHATGDRRLMEMLAEPMGWAVIERRFLPLIRVAALRDREDELRREREALMRRARGEGAL
ncbi:DNA transposition protein [Falsiroseomonas sp.]|uniref:DNA transposition protein n=1 Tax=Falsiroseomonas sp. TaxID=2870721 RepID=UPI00272906F0|nr:DNA transposition protein [Falsiroseomonas sp.]MDO9499004.1 DNA transposition protein [Falsiroseomonas sp.]